MANKRLGKDEAARQMASADKRVKGISSIADSAVRRSKAKTLELKKQYGTDKGNRQAVTSVDRALKSLAKSTEVLAHGVKQITVETARGVKNITASGAEAMKEYSKAITEDIHINRQNFMVTTIGKFTPLVGYAVAKMMETTVFKNMIEKMKDGLGKALNSVTSRFKKLAMAGWDKGKEFWNSMLDRISGKRGAIKTRMAKARKAKKEKRYYTKESAIKDALQDARVQAAAKKASKKNDIESQVPHMASGGYVKKEGLAKVHAAEVVQPVDKMVETIVDTVNKRLEAKEAKQKDMFKGTFLEKGEGDKRDWFGFHKVGESIKNTFQIMQKRQLGLETRVMKRDKQNRTGLIKSFFNAYSQEAKQEELPLMERQVRATLELKNTISGENKTAQAAWEKMLYEHPFFHGVTLLTKGLYKTVASPFKFLFKRRGKYANQLARGGTAFEKMVDIQTQTFTGLMEKSDDIIANTYVAAEAAAATAGATKGVTKTKNDTRQAPGQNTYSIAGFVARTAYKALVKAPARLAEWSLKKMGVKNKAWTGEKSVGGILKDDWQKTKDLYKERGKRGLKNFNEHQMRLYRESIETPKQRSNRMKMEQEKYKKIKADKLAEKKRKWAAPIKKMITAADRKEFIKDLNLGMSPKDATKKYRDMMDIRGGVDREARSTSAEAISKRMDKQTEEANKKFWKEKHKKNTVPFSSGGKDRSGKKTTAGALDRIANISKKNLFENMSAKKIAAQNLKGMTRFGGFFMRIVPMVMGFLSTGIAGLAGILGPILGGAVAIALSGAAGLAIGKLVDKVMVKPLTGAYYKHSDKKNKNAFTSQDNVLSGAQAKLKESRQSGNKADILSSYMKINQSANIGSNFNSGKYGATTLSINYPRIQAGQVKFMNENIGEYVKYGPTQIDRIRAEWTKHYSIPKPFTMSYEKYGEMREKHFLKWLTNKGKVLTQDELESDPRNARVLGQGPAVTKPKPFKPSPNTATTKNINGTKPSTSRQGLAAIKSFEANAAEQKRREKIMTIQAQIGPWLPMLNEMTGRSTLGALAVGFAQRKLTENPTALLDALDAVSKVSKAEWEKHEGDPAVLKLSQIVAKHRPEFEKGTQYVSEKYDMATGKVKKEWAQLKGTYEKVGFSGTEYIYRKRAIAAGKKFANKGAAYYKTFKANDLQKLKKHYTELKDKSPEEITEMVRSGALEGVDKVLNSDAANKAKDVYNNREQISENVKGKMMTMYDKFFESDFLHNSVAAFDSIKESYGGDATQFYNNTKKFLWDGLYDLNEKTQGVQSKLNDIYLVQRSNLEFMTTGQVSKATLAKLGAAGLTPNAQEKAANSGMTGTKVAQMGARKDVVNAELNSQVVDELKGVKQSVDTGTKTNAAVYSSTVANNSSVSSVTNNNSSGQFAPQRPLDPYMQQILTGNLS